MSDQPDETQRDPIRRGEDDTEGHGGVFRKATDDDDTEGHGGVFRKASDDDDDTEGHASLRNLR